MAAALILLSGGIDSSTLLHYVKRTLAIDTLYALSFHYGQRHARELDAAAIQAKAVGVKEHRVFDVSAFGALTAAGNVLTNPQVDVPDLDTIDPADRVQPPTYVPNRNMVLLSLAAAYAETCKVSDIYYGAQAQDEYGYWDCTTDFLVRINHLLALNRKQAVTVHAPFVNKRKTEVVQLGHALGVNYADTWTCYRGGDTPCSSCPSCVERAMAFREAALSDPLVSVIA
ncbi:MAG: 7-cyano-7-deazaguanine synthase QueC [Verrucomicrobia bacterium]|jgi:7-cyano-7-deazaguanine synthase|nr:7-cyano-7-deazaguanine synthase QueC [Verrucomicrobiota bacterium]MBT7067620.1 7-cyano-7-deazaguanine synthase QueC [Verrucomicrobiota bacterium]MBT7701575.1 7-cyano-7-deazaguanine synthase QueC [Verrucomicrobiota bacterium]